MTTTAIINYQSLNQEQCRKALHLFEGAEQRYRKRASYTGNSSDVALADDALLQWCLVRSRLRQLTGH